MRTSGRSLTAVISLLAALFLGAALAPAALASTPKLVGAASPAQQLSLTLPLAARDAALSRFAAAVSTPGNPLYGQYHSVGWLSRKFGASSATRQRAVRFLRRHGAKTVRASATGLFVDATMSAARAERMFTTSLAQFRTDRSSRSFTEPTDEVRIPKPLRGVATGVVGLDTEPLMEHPTLFHPQRRGRVDPASSASSAYLPVSGSPEGCSQEASVGGFTPNQYLSAYGFSTLQAEGLRGHGERVALIEIDGFKHSDLSTFANCFGLNVPPIKPVPVDLPKPLAAGGETELDLEMLITAAPDLSAVNVYETPAQAGSVLQALGKPLTAAGPKPDVISASLGLCETETLASIGRSGLEGVQAELEEATAMGISVLSSSGDDGSAGCIDQHSTSQLPLPQLTVDYPASSKWVTAVGGTNVQLNTDNTISTQEVWNDQADFGSPSEPQIGASGGGFSGLFPRPSYQNGTVTQNQRAVPDVGLLSDIEPGYVTYCTARGCSTPRSPSPWQPVGGTSAASPLLAGGFALIDQYLRERHLDNLGLANPLLYSIGRNPGLAPTVFDDVTVGSNDVGSLIAPSGRALGCCEAAAGFDEATGWGGLNLSTLKAIAARREPQIVKVALVLNRKQRPFSAGGIFARLHCDRTCLATASAVVTAGRMKPFTDRATVSHLNGGRSTISKIAFTHGQMQVLKEALGAHLRVTAAVTGGVVNGRGTTEQLTATKTLTITG